MSNDKLATPVQYLKGVGPKMAKTFSRLGVTSVSDLLFFFPREYEDRRNPAPIGRLAYNGELVTIRGEIIDIDLKSTRSRFSVLRITLADQSGRIKAIFFNQPFLLRMFRTGMRLILTGKPEVNLFEGGGQFQVRDYEIDIGKPLEILPIYPLTEGLYPKYIRNVMGRALESYLPLYEDLLPKSIKKKYKLSDLKIAISDLHHPKDLSLIEPARARVKFEELFSFQLGLLMRKKQIVEQKGVAFKLPDKLLEEFMGTLPFQLTAAQQRVFDEIKEDMALGRPMNRLLQGDVGSGKTIIAVLASLVAAANGYQTAIMAPTEILAQQHFAKIPGWLPNYKVKLVTGTTQKKEKLTDISDADIIIGTHALIEGGIKFKKLGLAIIDEQHRFGVLQRATLTQKGWHPDLLFMTATPIPRSLALSLYGDLDRSLIDEMPPGRIPIRTHYVPRAKRKASYEFMREKISKGQQVYVICPLVEESEESDLKAATEEAERLQVQVFKEFKVGLIHGRMKGAEKEKIMNAFKDGQIQILVSTTVIEVGIDVPNATIMVVEHAERFGLSQLHQLRGRVGRGSVESFCFLMAEAKTDEAKLRIKAMVDHTDGFKIAEMDLKLRGPGEVFGIRQAGLPEFRLADIIRDEALMREAREAAQQFLEEDPDGASDFWLSQRKSIKSS